MSFAAEFKQMKSAGGAPKLTESASKEITATNAAIAATPAPELTEAQKADAMLMSPLVDGQTFGEAAQVQTPEDIVVPPAKPVAPAKTYKINGKTFATEDEALDYAAKLEIELEKKEAFDKGRESAKPVEQKPPEVKISKRIADKLFEDPEAAIEDIQALIMEQAKKIVEDRESAREAKIEQAKTKEQLWDGFYKSNSDLSDWNNEVNIVYEREFNNIADLPVNEALAKLAEMSRAYVSSVKERALPKQILPSKTAITSSGGMPATTTKITATQKKISFADQVRSTNKRTTTQGST